MEINNQPIQYLNDPNEIDLGAHGVVEAHAGTGKTYTIENLVIKMICQPAVQQGQSANNGYVHLRELLLVTYTEKAAGELKTRIREGIQQAAQIQVNPDLKNHLLDCLNTMHEAYIGTIHGVCNRMLLTWPFETGTPFATQTVEDKEGIANCLRTVLRQDWQDTSTGIPQVLEYLEQQQMTICAEDFQNIQNLALQILDTNHSVLDREIIKDATCLSWGQALAASQKIPDRPAVVEFAQLVQEWGDCAAKVITQFTNNRSKSAASKRVQATLAQVQSFNDEHGVEGQELQETSLIPNGSVFNSEWVQSLAYRTKDKLFTDQVPAGNSTLQTMQNLQNQIQQCAWVRYNDLATFVREQAVPVLLYDTAQIVRDRWIQEKERKGLLSYQDMLSRMEYAVVHTRFAAELRSRLRFGIIDEFQDTAVQQWKIFSTLFLQDPQKRMRLYIVGDPKQSIYSFQGADVHTYLQAKYELQQWGARLYGLRHNYRSTPSLIAGYNTILQSQEAQCDWFVMPGVQYGERGDLPAKEPDRTSLPNHTITPHAVQVMVLEGTNAQRIYGMAHHAVQVIQSWVGQMVSIPKGASYIDRPLNYSDFAVVVETHTLADPFLKVLRSAGIPVAKYKIEGVFQSPMAQDMRVVLQAIVHQQQGLSIDTAVLLTHFFNYHPATIYNHRQALHAALSDHLSHWVHLAEQRQWSVLFRNITNATNVAERLLLLQEGERHLSDLRQLTQYCIEQLVRSNMDLFDLVEHLQMLADNTIKAGEDKNLHNLATDAKAVKVLTMHSSKGLEFPVVFVVPKNGGASKLRKTHSWVHNQKKHSLYCDYKQLETQQIGAQPNHFKTWEVLSKTAAAQCTGDCLGNLRLSHSLKYCSAPMVQSIQERRRLLYVALTRPCIALFVPAMVKSIAANQPDQLGQPGQPDQPGQPANQNQANDQLIHCEGSSEQDLTPRLLYLLAQNKIHRFDPNDFMQKGNQRQLHSQTIHNPERALPVSTLGQESEEMQKAVAQRKRVQEKIKQLAPARHASYQTSYTELSHGMSNDRAISPAEEKESPMEYTGLQGSDLPHDPAATSMAIKVPSIIPSGAQTGNAMHFWLERCIAMPDLSWAQSASQQDVPQWLWESITTHYSNPNQVPVATQAQTHALVAKIICNALQDTWDLTPLGEAQPVCLAHVPVANRRAELEFQMKSDAVWLHGFVDVVLRHNGKYYVLDWKSNTLPEYSAASIEASIYKEHYDLQAKLYCYALHEYLQSMLPDYDAQQHLGGALYVYLRSYETAEHAHLWMHKAHVEQDKAFVQSLLHPSQGE